VRVTGRSPGRAFRRLWAAYAVSAYGSGLGFGALPLTAVLVVHASPAQVSALSAAGPAAGALVAVPLAPWVERHRKRAVMIGMDVCRFAAMASIPVAHWLGRLGFAQLLAVSAVVAAARIAAGAASGAFLKILLPERDLVAANARLESTNWSSIAVGPPLGGAAAGAFGPVTTVFADALSYLLSALCLTAVRARGDVPAGQAPRTSAGTAGGISAGLRHLLGRPGLRSLWINNMLVSGLIMATEPLLAILLLRDLGFPPWQYGLAFAAPCLGGLVGSRLARRTVARHGRRRVLRVAGTLRAVWLIGLAATPSGTAGLVTVIAVELAIIVHMSLYTPVLAAYRLEQTPRHLVARTLTAWSVGQQTAIAVLTALAGLLADATGPRTVLTAAGLLALATPLLLPGRRRLAQAPVGRPERDARPAPAPGPSPVRRLPCRHGQDEDA
jgi:MFS family permease